MNCTCGGNTAEHRHEIKTRASADEWGANGELPITIYRDVCSGCGRERALMVSSDGVKTRRG